MRTRIGITQRVSYREEIDERRDVLDQRWYDFAEEIDIQLIPIPNVPTTVIEYVTSLNIKGIIFSGGNNIGIAGKELTPGRTLQQDDVAQERDKTEIHLLKWTEENQKSIIGVCRGFQFINSFYGGRITKVDPAKHVANIHQVNVEKEWKYIFGSSINVNSYHNWGVLQSQLADNLTPTVTSGIYVEGFQNKSGRIVGIMWHPERYNEFRKSDIKLFKQIFK